MLINFASEYPITLSDRVSVKVNRDNYIMKFLEGGVIISLQREGQRFALLTACSDGLLLLLLFIM